MIEVVSAAIVTNSYILLSQRAPNASYAFKWHAPGGKVEPDESHLGALRRELRQELGIELVGGLWSVVYVHELLSPRTGEMIRVHCYALRLEDIPSAMQARCLDKTIGVGWFDAGDLTRLSLAAADDANKQALIGLVS